VFEFHRLFFWISSIFYLDFPFDSLLKICFRKNKIKINLYHSPPEGVGKVEDFRAIGVLLYEIHDKRADYQAEESDVEGGDELLFFFFFY
jgi:hypothetical protein